ncbi:hypothetical protein GX441_04045 [bacterium]|nr:hypothetical protein [bacterium]
MYAFLFAFSLVGLALENETLKELEELYYEGSYERVIEITESLIASDSSIEKDMLLELHKYNGFSFVALEKRDSAKKEFKAILELEPRFLLDPQMVSPKIIEIFEEVRSEMPKIASIPKDSLEVEFPADTSDKRTILDYRKALLFSTAFPGVGQAYSGQRLKGWGFIAGEGLCIAGFIVSQVYTDKTHDEYLKATEPADIEAKYRVYNNWYKARNALGGLSIGIWFSAPLELVLFPPKWAKKR